ncbi:hypothetical protein F4860DRAFT_526880 [Xylaria cubensis]|nr:hypothetical protein F4860DRAFT_526880 [Xylaria cubensis]
MANVASTGAELLRSGEYSDFTLVCKGQEFRVHKSIVCPQSPVIAAALKSKFKEAKTNTIEVNFEPAILKCMLDYMYTGHYKDPAPVQPVQSVQDAQPSQPSQPAQPKSRGSPAQPRTEKKPVDATISQDLIYHAHVNSIADYYNVMNLAKVSATKIGELLDKRWSADAFCDLMQECRGSTGDKNLQKVLMQIAATHLFELTTKNLFSEGKIANDIAAGVLAASIKIFRDKASEVMKLNNQVLAEAAKVEHLEKNLKELTDVLLATRGCCKRECSNVFGCTIQRPTQNDEKRWLVRCSKCGCRHMYDQKRESAILAPPPAHF